MENDIFFINTPVEIQEEIYYDIIEKLLSYDISSNKVIYLRMSTSMSIFGKYYFEVYVCDNIVEHSTLNYPADFLIFLK